MVERGAAGRGTEDEREGYSLGDKPCSPDSILVAPGVTRTEGSADPQFSPQRYNLRGEINAARIVLVDSVTYSSERDSRHNGRVFSSTRGAPANNIDHRDEPQRGGQLVSLIIADRWVSGSKPRSHVFFGCFFVATENKGNRLPVSILGNNIC